MVYCGKPSRACEQCKERKVKCSLKPNCRPCIKAGLICSGPRDPNELVFRDESVSVIQKEVTRRRPRNLEVSIDDQARSFFIAHYVVGNSRVFDYIQPLLEQIQVDSHLSASFNAVSLAHFYSKAHAPEVLRMAQRSYIHALQLTNIALHSTKMATKDATMLAVLLLDLFEKITRTTPRSYESWTKHIKGALTLSKLRGKDQFQTTVGVRMFIQLSSNIVISCVQRDCNPPAELLELRDLAGTYMDVYDPKWQYSTLVMRFVEFRVAMKNGSLAGSEIIHAAKELDEKFQSILDNLPPVWKYDVINTLSGFNSEDVYEDYFHVFPDHRITHISNNVRLSRILLNETIREQCSQALNHPKDDAHYFDYATHSQLPEDTIASLAADICASVPQYTRVRRLHQNDPTSLTGVHTVISEPASSFPTFNDPPSLPSSPRFYYYPPSEDFDHLYTPFETARCYSLIFPLYIAARSAASPERLRKWVIGRLRFLRIAMNIVEAEKTAEVLEQNDVMNPWSVYAMLGSYSFSA